MKLTKVEVFGGDMEIAFRGDDGYIQGNLLGDSQAMYLWNQLEERIKHKLAERLGLEEPLHKRAVAVNTGGWSASDTTEDEDLVYDYRDLGLKERDCDH